MDTVGTNYPDMLSNDNLPMGIEPRALVSVNSPTRIPESKGCLPCDLGGAPYREKTFLDLFAGAGGLSLGLMTAGWRGLLAVEKNPMAFQTLHDNLICGEHGYRYTWPEWFPRKPCTVSAFIRKYHDNLLQLRGRVTLVAGGPPCQGFSLAGRRDRADVRNNLFRSYMQVVEAVQPLFILLENVRGIAIEFDKEKRLKRVKKVGRPATSYSQKIAEALEQAGYKVHADLVRAVDFGVPQFRPRWFLIAIRKGALPSGSSIEPFEQIASLREQFLRSKGLPIDRPITVTEAIADLETSHDRITECIDSPGFMQGTYNSPATHYQRLMHGGMGDSLPDSHRLANHRAETMGRFAEILATCRRGVQLHKAERERFGLKKNCIVPLDPAQPSHTLTTLPDDLIHYAEPRILSVREYARLQSIPDWFKFRGKYTTGGRRRRHECPRYTQAGNAVPPFLGEALGLAFGRLHGLLLEIRPVRELAVSGISTSGVGGY